MDYCFIALLAITQHSWRVTPPECSGLSPPLLCLLLTSITTLTSEGSFCFLPFWSWAELCQCPLGHLSLAPCAAPSPRSGNASVPKGRLPGFKLHRIQPKVCSGAGEHWRRDLPAENEFSCQCCLSGKRGLPLAVEGQNYLVVQTGFGVNDLVLVKESSSTFHVIISVGGGGVIGDPSINTESLH